AISVNNQTLSEGVTDAQGLATLNISDQHADGPAWLITATLGDDLNFIRHDDSAWVLDGIDAGGRSTPHHYDLLLYTERGAYRPGDTIHLTGLIRDDNGGVPPPFPLSVRVTRPDGRPVAEIPVTPGESDQGFFHVDYATSDDAQLGRYQFRVSLPGAKE